MMNQFTIKLEQFEGPLDLLLHLIEKRKLHINDVSLAQITDDYLSYIDRLEEFPIRDAAHFILVASTLVFIKSRSLLPTLPLSEEEQESIEDLERRLKEYRRIKELSRIVGEQYGKNRLFFRKQSVLFTPIFSPTREITLEGIQEAIKSVLKNLPQKEMIPQLVVEKIITIEEKIEDLTRRMTDTLTMSFKEYSKDKGGDKTHVIIGFLAILELVKRGIFSVTQNTHYDDIIINKTKEE